ncbi:uncharacterized protein LTR77_007144 [Saxophila tyrrhenica]|uniref:alpha-glucosidase n=1 Tax=Saxophila tyrrhenica TaxID=1690608 RepID=A0AAV9P4K3_9PEZI|nr:hypothetical protein LTR77_007144 [Saxophila tyrrhenica]
MTVLPYQTKPRAGSGQYVAHWGGDNAAEWGAMYLSISQSFIFQMVGVPVFGVDTCGFANNSTEQLCARWMELSAFFPFYRNHYADGKRPQEAYVWPTVAEASRRAIGIRYQLLSYLYTLMHYAHTRGDTIMRALAWEFANDVSLRETDNQFLVGSSVLVTPVLVPGADTVKGVFPGIGKGTRWYDWHSLKEVTGVQAGENVTMAAPLEHINVHVRGGAILPMQQPGYTTTATRANPYSLLVALDENDCAAGSIYLDDGESIVPESTRMVEFTFADSCLTARSWGSYPSGAGLANITVLGLAGAPQHVRLRLGGRDVGHTETAYENGTLSVMGLEHATRAGAWEDTIKLCLNEE